MSNPLDRLPRGVRRLFRLPPTRDRMLSDADEEMRFHIDAWTEELREAYADRIVARLGRHIRNLERASIARLTLALTLLAPLLGLLGIQVFLGLTVQVRRNWRRDDRALREFGFRLTS